MLQRLLNPRRNYFPCSGQHYYKLFISIVATGLTITIVYQILDEKTSRNWYKFHEIHEERSLQSGNSRCLYVSVWDKDLCERTFENLVLFPKFPLYPDRYYYTDNLNSVAKKSDLPSIKRIQTHLRPIESGFYKFRVRSSLAVRIFLETRQPHEICVLIDYPGWKNGKEVYSNSYLLESHFSYYIEVILFYLPGKHYFDIEWLVPGSAQFRHIQSPVFVRGSHVLPFQYPVRSANKIYLTNQLTLLGFIPKNQITRSFLPCHLEFRTSNVIQEMLVFTPSSSPPAHIKEVVKFITQALQNTVPR